MLDEFKEIAIVVILLVSLTGGAFPLLKKDKARSKKGVPLAEAFSVGVFLALSLTLMLPASSELWSKALPAINYPLESVIMILAFMILLSLEHVGDLMSKGQSVQADEDRTSPAIAIIMTVMIAIPSFLLGVELGVEESVSSILMIFIAVIVHKGSASFAIALNLVRSTLTNKQTYVIFGLFALMTPTGVLFGEYIHHHLAGREMIIIKAIILSLAAGTFLFMSTLHDFQNNPMIKSCNNVKGFSAMMAGVILTAFVRYVLG